MSATTRRMKTAIAAARLANGEPPTSMTPLIPSLGRRCPHCGRTMKAPDGRGLCWKCYKDTSIRGLYPRGKVGRKPVEDA